MDQFSKFAFAFPMRNQEAATVAEVLVNNVFSYFGMPLQILSDQGRNFESELFKELCRCLGITKIRTSSYHPSTNGMLERFHRTLNSMLAKVVKESQRDWDQHLPQVMGAYRSSIHTSTGYSPNFLLFGQENRAPVDLVMGTPETFPEEELSCNEFVEQKQRHMLSAYNTVRNSLKETAQRRKQTYDMGVKQKEFLPGQRVWYYYPRRYVKKSQKFQFFYVGPYTIVKRIGPVNYSIQKDKRSAPFVVHVDKLKLCVDTIESINMINDTSVLYHCRKKEEMPKPKTTKVCEVCGKEKEGMNAIKSHARRHKESERKAEAARRKRELEIRRSEENEERSIEVIPGFGYAPEAIWNKEEVEDMMREQEMAMEDEQGETSNECARILQVKEREEREGSKSLQIEMDRFLEEYDKSGLGELLDESQEANAIGGETSREERKQRRGKEPMKRPGGSREKGETSEKKKKEGEEMIKWLRELIVRRGEEVSVDELWAEAKARYMKVGPTLKWIIYGIRDGLDHGREKVIETRTEIREVVRPVCIVMERTGGSGGNREGRREEEEEDEYEQAGREEEEEQRDENYSDERYYARMNGRQQERNSYFERMREQEGTLISSEEGEEDVDDIEEDFILINESDV